MRPEPRAPTPCPGDHESDPHPHPHPCCLASPPPSMLFSFLLFMSNCFLILSSLLSLCSIFHLLHAAYACMWGGVCVVCGL